MNSYLPHHLRRVHNNNIVGGAMELMENVPIPILELAKPQEKPLMDEVDRLFLF